MNQPWLIYVLVLLLIAFVVMGNTKLISLVLSAMTVVYAAHIYDEVCK